MAVGLKPIGKPLELLPTSIATAPRFYSTRFINLTFQYTFVKIHWNRGRILDYKLLGKRINLELGEFMVM